MDNCGEFTICVSRTNAVTPVLVNSLMPYGLSKSINASIFSGFPVTWIRNYIFTSINNSSSEWFDDTVHFASKVWW